MARDAVAEIRERIDIIDLIQGYVPSLKKTGRSYKGLCPFHQEKTPSFVVFPDSQNFHCFGCGKGGDLFTFYMLAENTEFRDALKELAIRAGVTLDLTAAPTPEHDAHRRRLIEANELAATFFSHVLAKAKQGEAGRQTVAQRGVSPEMVERFRLGFAPESWSDLLNFLTSRDVPAEIAQEAGLLQERDNGGHYDRFRNRLMFPIRDRDGDVVGFGGRAMGDAMPKYLNSPQTPVFDKSSLVYALDLAKEPIRKSGEVVIVEGYMDVIAAHQFGYENVVASMGTALTESQLTQVKRGSSRVVLALDSDTAGQVATGRGLIAAEQFLESTGEHFVTPSQVVRWERKLRTQIGIVALPEGKDPDELIRKDAQSWPKVVESAIPFLDFLIRANTSEVDLSDPKTVSKIVHDMAPMLQSVEDPIEQGQYIRKLAQKLGMIPGDERIIISEVRRVRLAGRSSAQRAGVSADAVERVARRPTEDLVVALFLKHPDLTRDVVARIPIEELTDIRNRELVRVLRDEAVADLAPEQIVIALDDHLADHAEVLLATLEGRPEQFPGQIRRESEEMLIKLGRERFDFLMKQLDSTLKLAVQEDDEDALRSVKEQIGKLAERHRQFYPPPSPYFLDSRSPARH